MKKPIRKSPAKRRMTSATFTVEVDGSTELSISLVTPLDTGNLLFPLVIGILHGLNKPEPPKDPK